MTNVLAAATLALVTPCAWAEGLFDGKSEAELIAVCADRSASMSDREAAGTALTYRRSITLSTDEQQLALTCLEELFGTPFTYNGFDLYSVELDTAAAEQASAEHDARREALMDAITEACNTEYNRDRFRAVMNPDCRRIFTEQGLPPDQ